MEQTFVDNVLPKLGLGYILKMRKSPLWISYDREGDALHVIFEEARKTDKAVLDGNDIIVTRRGRKVVNITVLNASRFAK